MIQELKLSNFRIFDDEVKIDFRPITVLIGRNSSGKSSLIKFLLMLQQSLRPPYKSFLNPEGDKVKMGNFQSLKNSLTNKKSLQFGLRIESNQISEQIEQFIQLIRQGVDENQEQMLKEPTNASVHRYQQTEAKEELKALFEYEADVPYTSHGTVKQVIKTRSNQGLEIEKEKVESISSSVLMDFSAMSSSMLKEKNFRKSVDENFPIMALLQGGSSDDTTTFIRDMYDNMYLLAQAQEITNLQHLSATRKVFSRVIEETTPPENSVEQDGRFAISHLQHLIEKESENTLLLHYLKSITDVEDVRFEGKDIVRKITAKNSKTKARTYLAEFGFGVGQVLPVIVQGVIQEPHTHLMVEQPEAQLHPTAQLELGSFFADIWKKRNVMSIIETHSDNILLRLRRLIAKGELDKEDVSVAFFTMKEEKQPIIRNLQIEEDGSMEDGLPIEFFHANIEEALKMRAGK